MSFNKVIPYTSSVGSKFLINFSDFQEQEFSLPVVDVSLVLAESVDELLSLKDLIEIVRIIIDFLNDNQVVLYNIVIQVMLIFLCRKEIDSNYLKYLDIIYLTHFLVL